MEGNMIDGLFRRPHVRARLRASPLWPHLEAYVARLEGLNYPAEMIRRHTCAVEHFGRWLGLRRLGPTEAGPASVRSFLLRHLPRCRCPLPAPTRLTEVRAALNHLSAMLSSGRDLGADSRPPSPADALVERYRRHLSGTCGLAEATCRYRVRYAREFLQDRFGGGELRPEAIRPTDPMSFVAEYADRCRPSSAQVAASSLRSFLRYLQLLGLCDANLAAAVPRTPRWRLAGLPKTMTDEQLGQFLAHFDRSTATGRRDYAMALCQVDLGLRASEVAGLCLESFDWRRGVVCIVGGKACRTRELPLPEHVGEAVTAYLRRGRPTTSCRSVFVRHRGPTGGTVGTELIRGVMRRAYAEVDGCARWTGTHVLRRTAGRRNRDPTLPFAAAEAGLTPHPASHDGDAPVAVGRRHHRHRPVARP